MVTEYNRNLIMRRRMEAEIAAEMLASAAPAAEEKKAEVFEAEEPVEVVKSSLTTETDNVEEVKPKKTDAEKLKRGKKRNV